MWPERSTTSTTISSFFRWCGPRAWLPCSLWVEIFALDGFAYRLRLLAFGTNTSFLFRVPFFYRHPPAWLVGFLVCILSAPFLSSEERPNPEVQVLEDPASIEPETAEPEKTEATTDYMILERKPLAMPEGIVDVYVIPIRDAISKPNLYILRRGLKEGIANEVDMVLLDMDTPGGRVDYTIEMMEMLARFDGITATYVNNDAISAGSFITAATQEIYFSPQGKIGASAVIMGGGQDVPETAKMKIESYLRANIRVITEDYPYRSDVVRAMLDSEFELKIGDDVIKSSGELTSLLLSQTSTLAISELTSTFVS